MTGLFKDIYNGKTVLITGHTGFKGSWLALFLQKLGANIIGYSLPTPTEPSHYKLLNFSFESIIADINEVRLLSETIARTEPEIVFHLAAQPLVRESYENPILTYQSNVVGSISVYEACRYCESVKAIVSITTDKVYENLEWVWSYRENDRLGGHDLYSSSKACMELMTKSYRNSFFPLKEFDISHQILISTARAGNVIGGGDWAKDRLIPDIVKSTVKNEKTEIRNPQAVRPWQHVLEPITGYLLLGQKLLERKREFSGEWNFGPSAEDFLSVMDLTEVFKKKWEEAEFILKTTNRELRHEARLLKLDSTKAKIELGWFSVWSVEDTLEKTVEWYQNFYTANEVRSQQDLDEYCDLAATKKTVWTL